MLSRVDAIQKLIIAGLFIALAATESFADNFPDVSDWRRLTNALELTNELNAKVWEFRVSGDGRFLVFTTPASNVVANDNNGVSDIFIADLVEGGVRRLADTEGAHVIDISGDGRYLLMADREPKMLRVDLETNEQLDVTGRFGGQGAWGAISFDGSQVAFVSNTPWLDPTVSADSIVSSVMLWNGNTDEFKLVSRNLNGEPEPVSTAGIDISDNGSRIVFQSLSKNLVSDDTSLSRNIFLFDTGSGELSLVSRNETVIGNAPSDSPAISGDGAWVVFRSKANNLSDAVDHSRYFNVYAKHIATGAIKLLSVDSVGEPASNGHCYFPRVSPDGSSVVFGTDSTNLFKDTVEQAIVQYTDGELSKLASGTVSNYSRNLYVTDDLSQLFFQTSGAVTSVQPVSFVSRLMISAGNLSIVSLANASYRAQAVGDFGDISASSDGRFIAFSYRGDDLVPREMTYLGTQPAGRFQIYVLDRETGLYTIASKDENGLLGAENSVEPVISGDGSRVMFTTHAHNLLPLSTREGLLSYDMDSQSLKVVAAEARLFLDYTYSPDLSHDGNKVVYSTAYVSDEPNNGFVRVRSYDFVSNEHSTISVDETGSMMTAHASRASISADGNVTAFVVDNLQRGGVFLRKTSSPLSQRLTEIPYVPGLSVELSGDGSVIATGRESGEAKLLYLDSLNVRTIGQGRPVQVGDGGSFVLIEDAGEAFILEPGIEPAATLSAPGAQIPNHRSSHLVAQKSEALYVTTNLLEGGAFAEPKIARASIVLERLFEHGFE